VTAGRQTWSSSRSRTIKPNGGLVESLPVPAEPTETVPIGEAMRRAVEALGDVKVDPGLAPTQLLELGECYEDVARRQAAYDAKAEEAKTARKSLESAKELLLEKVRTFTHPAPLPLFDTSQAEADREAMLGGGDVDNDQGGDTATV
jgi:hypothetical protein